MDRLFSISCLILVAYLIIMFNAMFTLSPIGLCFVKTMNEFVNTIAIFLMGKLRLVLVISSFLDSLFSCRLFYVIIAFLFANFLIGWINSRDKMKAMVRAVFDEGKLICAPLPAALSKIWDVLSNPWKLILLAVFISFVRLQPALWIHILKAAEKSI